jgi:multidrug transporter EmrE-like cation transporter
LPPVFRRYRSPSKDRHQRSYAIWSGVGTALIALIGFGWFREPLTTLKIVSIVLIVAGVFGPNAGVRAG